MKPRAFTGLAISALSVLALPGAASAQTEAVLGKGDAAFATELLRSGYSDLAEKLCALLQAKGNLDPDEALGVKALHLDLRLDLALREPDLIKRKDLLAGILQEKEDLVRQYAGRKISEETAATLPEVYGKLGEAITLAIQKEKSPELIAELQKEGAQIFTAAEQKLTARITELRDQLASSENANPELEGQFVAVSYNLPRTQYFHALLFGKADTLSRDTLLDASIKGFQEFSLDHGDTGFAYEGLVYEGLCQKEKGKFDDALQAFDDAIGLREDYNKRENQDVYELDPYAAELVARGVLEKVKLLIELERPAEAIEEARTFWRTTPTPEDVRHGLAVLAQQAEAQLKTGDVQGASDAADKLVEFDRGGPWGAVGRELQGRMLAQGGPIDPEKVRRIASTLLERGDVDAALRVARQGIEAAKGDPKNADAGVELCLIVAQCWRAREGFEHEAAAAYDVAFERFGTSERAAEAIYQASQIYLTLAGTEKKAFYKQRRQERQHLLTTRFAAHPRAARAQLGEAEELQKEGKFKEAAEFYARIPPTSSVYLDAQFGQGDCYLEQAFLILKEKKEAGVAEARPLAEQAEGLMRKAMSDADAALDKTLDLQQRAAFDNIGLRTRNRLAQLYLLEPLGWAEKVLPLLEGTDDRYASNEEVISRFWEYRIQALSQLGKLEEAVKLLDALMKRSPDSRAIGPAAGTLARALDVRQQELRDQKKTREADELLRKAASYYSIAAKLLLKSENPKVALVESTAKRLYAIGLIVNQVPAEQDTFIGWDSKRVSDGTYWELAAELLQAAVALRPGYQLQVLHGRCLGFLGQYPRAASVLGALFEQEKVWDAQKRQLNRKILQAKPELTYSFFEFGYAEHRTGKERQDAENFRRAQDVFEAMSKNLTPDTSLWWWARYLEVLNLHEWGFKEKAQLAMNDLERTTAGLGEKFGLSGLFMDLKNELK